MLESPSDVENERLIQENQSADEFDEDDIQSKYQEILTNTISKTKLVILTSSTFVFATSSRHYILASYSLSISTFTVSDISNIIFAALIFGAILTFLVTSLGDRIGHDKILCAACILSSIGLFLESISQNILVFFLGFFCNRIGIISVTTAYIALMLPHKYAVKYIALKYTIAAVAYLLGPVISGFITDYIRYRFVFWINFIITTIVTLFVLIFIYGSQSNLQQQQLSLPQYFVDNQAKDDKFPSCEVAANGDSKSISYKMFVLSDSNKNELTILILSLFQNCLCWVIEAMLVFYFALFMLARYDISSFVETSGMITLFAFFFAISNIALPKLIDRILPNHMYVVIFACILLGITSIINSLQRNEALYYWIYLPIYGMSFGIVCIGTEMCILESLPKQHSGKVVGLKGLMRISFRATGVWFVGEFWMNSEYNSLWFASCSCCVFILVLSIPILFLAKSMKQ